jgi:dipeptidyl aminopeptidase/acylaminoacyl peptidase
MWFANWDIGGPFWNNSATASYEKYDPIQYADKWNTPILVIQGGIDFRVPANQGFEAFQLAQLKGIKSKLLYFPDECHWILKPQDGLLWQREFYKWLDETL